VEISIRIAANPETVFPFSTDPEKMLRWKGVEAALEPRTGGVYRVNMGRYITRGEYVEVTPYSRVVFTWGWEDEGNPVPPGSSTVEVDLLEDGDGTIVRLRHCGLPTEQARELHGEGWTHYLARLILAAEGGDPGPDPWNADPHT